VLLCLYVLSAPPYYIRSICSNLLYLRLSKYKSLTCPDLDPLTTEHFRWHNLFTHNELNIILMPVSFNISTYASADLSDSSMSDGEIDEDRNDYSALSNVDPDKNISTNDEKLDCRYYTASEFNKSFPNSNNFSLYHVNLRSIPNNIDKLTYFLEEINLRFNIIAISETWLQEHNTSLYNLRGYNHEYSIRDKRIGGGVSLFISKSIEYKTRSDLVIDIVDVNTLVIEIPKREFQTKHNILVVVCYRPPNVQQSDFIENLDKFLDLVHRENSYVYFTGDTNFNTLKLCSATNTIVNDYHNLFLSYSYQPLIDKPTREINDSSTLIDHVYTNIPQCYTICKSAVMKHQLADHYSIICITDHMIQVSKKTHTVKRDYSIKNKHKFKKSLKSQSWNYIYHAEDINLSFTYFQNQFLYMIEEHFPEKKINIKYDNRLPWVTDGLRNSIKHKHKLINNYKQNPTEDNKDKYKKYHNKLVSLMRTAERNFYHEQLELNNKT